ncbi:MAG TPA: glycosyltransferase family 39 protein [Chloroflexota bacterium]|nr:glycosyltransferase family 39 protein [Chloroflexota bacterium]
MALPVLLFLIVAGQFLYTAPILENPDGYGHYLYIHTLAREGRFPRLDELTTWVGEEAGQFPLYYLVGAALILPLPDSDLNNVVIPNPHGPKQADDNPNLLFHRPFQGFPTGAELAVRVVELFSILCGAFTVACTVLLARLLAPDRPWEWTAAGAALAANPAFAYISSSVTNDTLVTALSSLAVLLMAHWLLRKPNWGSWAAAAVTGLAILAKFNAIALVLPYLGVTLVVERTAARRLDAAAKLLLAVAASDGWWFVRNAIVYGDPTAVFALNRNYFGNGYAPLTLSAAKIQSVLATLPLLSRTFFAMFGRYVITSHAAYAFIGSVTATGLVLGLIALLKASGRLSALLISWIVLTVAEAIAYSFASISGGRFIYPAIAPIAVITVAGWAWLLVKLKAVWLGPLLLVAGVGVSFACAWFVVKPAFAYPAVLAQLPASARPVQATFDDAVQLIGMTTADLSFVQPGQPIELTLYWRLSKPVNLPLSSFVHVDSADPAYSPGIGYEGAPGKGLYPPNFWRPGEIVVDHHSFVLQPDQRTDRRNAIPLQVRVGMYYLPPVLGSQIQRVPVEPVEAADRGLEVAAWKIAGQPSQLNTSSPVAHFGPDITLTAAQARMDGPAQLAVDLDWLAQQQPSRDDTVFVHVVAANGTLVAQHDSYPLDGRYPTSQWSPGEQVFDTVRLALPRPLLPGDQVEVGLYVLPGAQPLPPDSGAASVQVPISHQPT